jgi:uncharacterized membrane protein
MNTDLRRSPEMRDDTARTEAFSDGVFAIAITLLVLDIKVPHDLPENTSLLTALLNQWPIYMAFLTSFATIGIMWLNHHRMFRYIRRVDHWFLVLNGLLLLGVTFVPFPTSLAAEYVLRPDRTVAVLIYTGTFTLIALAFNVMWWYAAHNNRLLDENADRHWARSITRRYRLGPLLYFTATLLALVNIWVSLFVNAALAVLFLLPYNGSPVSPTSES